jgi:hypothetical protein
MHRSSRAKLAESALALIFGGLVVSAFGLMFYHMGASNAQYNFERDQNSQAYATNTVDQIESDCIGVSVAAQAECIEKAIVASAEYQQNEGNLNAQRSMSKWAFWLLIVAGFQMLATVIGLIYLRGTLDATLKAVKGTSDGTNAMHASNDQNKIVQQAWLNVEASDPVITDTGIWYLSLTVKNIGKTIAKTSSIELQWSKDGVFAERPDPAYPMGHIDFPSVHTIEEGKSAVGGRPGSHLSFEETPYAVGCINYETVFGDLRKSYFRFKISRRNNHVVTLMSSLGSGVPKDT